jgi:hypothetical protein
LKVLTDAKDRQFAFSPYILGELCFLQLRMMCELIALGCLLVHGDIPATRTSRMQKAYAADWIIGRLTDLHPSFYPSPGIEILNEATGTITIEPNKRPHLTKAKLIGLYTECGTMLHRGTLKSILANDPKLMDLTKVLKYAALITQLLTFHRIALLEKGCEIWVVMRGKEDGKVHCSPMLFTPDA